MDLFPVRHLVIGYVSLVENGFVGAAFKFACPTIAYQQLMSEIITFF